MRAFPRCDRLLHAGLFLLVVALPVRAEDDGKSWNQFLGPRRDGISRETGLNLDWNAKPPKVLWKAALGLGFASQSIAGDRLFTFASRGNREWAVCLDASTGKELWARDLAPTYIDRQRQGSGARSTPTFAKDRIYCLLPMGELACLAAVDGKVIWQTNIFQTTGARNRVGEFYYWGMSGSPLVEGDLVVVQPGGDKNNSVTAFHKETGKLVWSLGDDPPGYSSPIAIDAAGRRQVIACTGKSILGIDSTRGELLWRYSFVNDYDCNCATPQWADNVLFMSSAYGTGAVALEIAAAGAKVQVKEKWRNKVLQNQFTTSVILDGHIYGCHGDLGATMLKCVELQTGKEKWSDRRPAKCGLLAVEGHLLVLSERGTLRLVAGDPKGYLVKGELPNLMTYKAWAAPALANGRLYLRDDRQLICLDLRK